MKVSEMIKWLKTQDQEAIVSVVSIILETEDDPCFMYFPFDPVVHADYLDDGEFPDLLLGDC